MSRTDRSSSWEYIALLISRNNNQFNLVSRLDFQPVYFMLSNKNILCLYCVLWGDRIPYVEILCKCDRVGSPGLGINNSMISISGET